MGNESQFEDKSQLTTYLSSSSTMRDATESALVVKWWAESLKGLNNSITLSIPHPSSPVFMPLNVTFPNYVRLNDVLNIFDSLSNSDIKKEYPFFKNSGNIQSLIGPLMGTYSDANQVTAFNYLTSTPSGRVFAPPVPSPEIFVKVSGDSSNPGLIQLISDLLSQDAFAPKQSDDIHVKIFSQLARSMNNKAMTSMLRSNAIGGTQKSALNTNWKMIVEMPKMIERRMKVSPKNPMEYKQKLQLKDYGRQLSQLLNTRIEFVDENGLRREEFVYNLPTLKELYDDPAISAQVNPILIQIGNLMNLIQPELDKDTDLYRKYLTKLIPNNRITKEVNTLY
jgi:hypothetical protein